LAFVTAPGLSKFGPHIISPTSHKCVVGLKVKIGENIKQAKGNECSQYKSAATIFSSSLPVCQIHIFSSDIQACFALVTSCDTACFALVTSHYMPTHVLNVPLYA
jgi:hypothetical protein